MLSELSKKDKAVLRQLIDKGVQAEFENALNEAASIIQQWQQNTSSNKEAYHALFTSLQQNNDFIALRYDGITGSRYVPTVVDIYSAKQVDENDLMNLSAEVREYIKRVAAMH